MGLLRLSAPPALPVTLAEARAHLRIEGTADDVLLDSLIRAATDALDGAAGLLGRALVTQTWRWTLDDFPSGRAYCLAPPLPPHQSLSAIRYVPTAGASPVTLATSAYRVSSLGDPFGCVIEPVSSWPSTSGERGNVEVDLVCGFPPTEDSPVSYTANVPAPIRAAILQHCAQLYSVRESAFIGQSTPHDVPGGYAELIAPWRTSWW